MKQYPPAKQIQIRKAILIFIKNVGPPLVLYVDDPDALYEEIKEISAKASAGAPKLIEKIGKGPLKKICVFDTQIAGVAIQEEQHLA